MSKSIFYITLIISMLSCGEISNQKTSKFNLKKNYEDFSNTIKNSDTLMITTVLSIDTWEAYDRLEITKKEDSIFIQITEKTVMDKTPLKFPKIVYNLSKNTHSIEKIFQKLSDSKISDSSFYYSPFFIIKNKKEKDSIVLRTKNHSHRLLTIEAYNKLIYQLYPKEMKKYNEAFKLSPPD